MFEDDEHIEVIPIFLAHQDKLPEECLKQYPNIRVIDNKDDMEEVFKDIDICINNLWVALDYISHLKHIYQELSIVTVCHSTNQNGKYYKILDHVIRIILINKKLLFKNQIMLY